MMNVHKSLKSVIRVIVSLLLYFYVTLIDGLYGMILTSDQYIQSNSSAFLMGHE